MKREAFGHAKFRLVARDLKISVFSVYGLMASIWNTTAVRFPRGDIGRLTNEEIAAEIEGFDGDGERLIQVLVARRLLDVNDGHRLVVHDWPEHADGHVHAYLAKRRLFFANGEQPRLPHDLFDGPTRTRIRAEYRENGGESPAPIPTSSGSPPGDIPLAPGELPPMPVPVPVPPSDQETTESKDSTVGAPARADSPVDVASVKETPRSTAQRRGKLSHFVPDDFALNEERAKYATDQGLSRGQVASEFEKMRDHEFRDPHSDWDRTWKRWIRTAVERIRPNGRGSPSGRSLHAADQSEAAFLKAQEARRGR